MKKLFCLLVTATLLTYCACPKETIIEHQTITHYVDSTRWHDTTIYHVIPVERYRDYTSLLDTLHLETSMAEAKAYVDTSNNILKGSIENKNDSIKTVIKWKERLIYRDSIQIKEVPVEVEKLVTKYPKSYWWFMGITIALTIYVALKIFLKLKFNIKI